MRFTTATLLLLTAFVAVALGSILWWSWFIHGDNEPFLHTFRQLGIGLPLWLPFAFAGYAIGRRRLTVSLIIALVVMQMAAAGITYAILQSM